MNKKILKLRNELKAVTDEQRTMIDLQEQEDRSATEDEQTKFDALNKRAAAIEAKIEMETSLAEREARLQPVDTPEWANDGGVTPEAARARENQPAFRSFGEQLVAVWQAGTNRGVDPRLHQVGALSGLGESVDSDGGYLVQPDFSQQIMTRMFEGGQILPRVTRITVGGNGLEIPGIDETSRASGSRWGGVSVSWKEEGGSPTAGKPKTRLLSLKLKKLIGLVYSSDELVADATAMEGLVNTALQEEMIFKAEDSVINGTGAGQPLGIYNAPCLVTVSKEAGQAADTIVAENILKMYARMPASSIPRSAWLINQDCWPQIFQLHIAVGTGGLPVFVPANGLADAPFGSLLGRPIIPIEYGRTVGDKGDIYFVDLSQYLLIEKGGVQAASSMHVKFIYDEMTYRFTYRLDGAPTWNSALTPYKGSNTQSPFIALAARA